MSHSSNGTQVDEAPTSVERLVLEAIRGLRFGSVEITLHDSQVVQIQRSEKLRVTGTRQR